MAWIDGRERYIGALPAVLTQRVGAKNWNRSVPLLPFSCEHCFVTCTQKGGALVIGSLIATIGGCTSAWDSLRSDGAPFSDGAMADGARSDGPSPRVDVPIADATQDDSATDAPPGCGPNLILNPGFELGFTSWSTGIHLTDAGVPFGTIAVSTLNPHDGLQEARADTTTLSELQWESSLGQDWLPFTGGSHVMRLSFWVRGMPDTWLRASVQRGYGGYLEYCYFFVSVNPNWTQFNADCVTSDDVDGQLGFGFAQATGPTFIDSVSLRACEVGVDASDGDATDSGSVDAGVDAARDGGVDAAHDAGVDAPVDSPRDTAADVVRDAAIDVFHGG